MAELEQHWKTINDCVYLRCCLIKSNNLADFDFYDQELKSLEIKCEFQPDVGIFTYVCNQYYDLLTMKQKYEGLNSSHFCK